MSQTKIFWNNPQSSAGISSLLFIIPAIIHKSPLLYGLTYCSFLSDYVNIGKKSYWHIIDRNYSLLLSSYVIYINYFKIKYGIVSSLINNSLLFVFCIHLFTKYCIKIQNKCLFDICHTIWHIIGSFYFIIYYDIDYTYNMITKFTCNTNNNRIVYNIFLYILFWILNTILFYSIGKNINNLYPSCKSWITPLSITRSLTAFIKSIFITLLITSYIYYDIFSSIKYINTGYILTETSGYIFITYEIVDLFIEIAIKNMQYIYIFHHIIHILIGFYLFFDSCRYYTIASYIMSQEITGIFLNPLIIIKNIDNNNINNIITYLKLLFIISFILFRLVISPYATILYLNNNTNTYIEKYIIKYLLLMGNSLQYFWAYKLIKYKKL